MCFVQKLQPKNKNLIDFQGLISSFKHILIKKLYGKGLIIFLRNFLHCPKYMIFFFIY